MSRTRMNLKGLSLDRLETLSAIVEQGSIMRAAGGDANRQSQFSRQVAELEAWFGVNLLDRSSTPSRPTEAALRIAKHVDDFRREMDAVKDDGQAGRRPVVFGAGERMIRSYLIPWAARNVRDDMKFVFRNLTSSAVRAELLAKRVDFGILRVEDAPKEMVNVPLKPIPMSLMVPLALANHRRKWTWKDLQALRFAVLEGSGRFRTFLLQMAAESGVDLDVAMECSTWSQMMDAMTACNLAGFLPKDLEDRLPPGRFRAVKFSGISSYTDDFVISWSATAIEKRPDLTILAKKLGAGRPQKAS
jgi:DNA-binding transcriptional LysR family regulator